MKYKYEFSTGDEEIEVSKKWDRILHELDHAENYADIKETRSCVHYDALDDPGFLVNAHDKGISSLFDGSAAFDYAVAHLKPRQYDLLYRRVIRGEMFTVIAKDYGVDPSGLTKLFKLACKRFIKYYDEGKRHAETTGELPLIIPYGLDEETVKAIRAYRAEH